MNPMRALFTALCLTTATAAFAQTAPVVDAPAGAVRGQEDNGIRSFRGIPFAQPPVANLRWMPPMSLPHWAGERDASQFGAACIQPHGPATSIYAADPPLATSEDCLTLNVWTPAKAKGAPVLVWIHGGALVSGSSREALYDGQHMAERGVIVVSINYRLGVLGWLAHPELSAQSPAHISGNYGLMDQIAALQWVRRNIAAFGGDPANVTIAGESAGALSVMYLLESPPAHGLFARAISESGYMISTAELKRAVYGAPSGEAPGAAASAATGSRPG